MNTSYPDIVLHADVSGMRFASPIELYDESVDVVFGEHRVWSTVIRHAQALADVSLSWPDPLLEYLHGDGDISIVRSVDGDVLAATHVVFSDSGQPLEVRDGRGRWLAMNKWGNLGVPIDGQDSEMEHRLLVRAQELMDELRVLGHQPFLSSGSLLGAVRTGTFLPHDDDIDLGNLSRETHPADLLLESRVLERTLIAHGHTVVRHSGAHLQVIYLHDSGELDHYIDIFTAYFDPDGTFNQPFSIRGTLDRSQLQPFAPIALDGENFLGPASPPAWLEQNYGPSWQVPDPGFQFEVAPATTRRFDAWFGTYNVNRDFWEAQHAQSVRTVTADEDRVFDELVQRSNTGDHVVDLGSGLSTLASRLVDAGRTARAVDFSLPALHAQASVVSSSYVNFNDRRDVLGLTRDLIESGNRVHFALNHTWEGLGGDGSENVYLLLRWLLRDGAVAVVSVDTDLPNNHVFEDPRTWHVPVDTLTTRAHGLNIEIVAEYDRDTELGQRSSALAVVTQAKDHGGI